MGADGTEPGAGTGPGMEDGDDSRAGVQVMSRDLACISRILDYEWQYCTLFRSVINSNRWMLLL